MNSLDTQALLAQGRHLTLPATLEICLSDAPDKVSALQLLRTFRVLPGKRIVALVRWNEALAVAKIFFARGRWEQHVNREVEGIRLLREAGLPTPALLGAGQCLDGDSGFVLLDYLADSESVRERWERSKAAVRLALLRDVVALIARCHSQGLLQKDIHLDNFLLQGDALALLDAAALEHHEGDADGVDAVNSLRNLALFFAQFPVSNDTLVAALYAHYRALRPDAQLSPDAGVLMALLRKKRLARMKVVLNKLFRETTATACVQNWSRFAVYRRDLTGPQWQDFIVDPDAAMARGSVLKNGNSSTVVRVCIDGRDVVIKRYNLKTFWHVLKRLFFPTRAWHSWRNAHMLTMLGIATPAPLLMMERRFGPLRRVAWYVADHVEGVDVQSLLRDEPAGSALWQETLEQFRQLFGVLREYAIVHGDTKATNFIRSGDALQVLDLDAMRQELDFRRFRRASAKDLQRFAKNWEHDKDTLAAVQQMLTRLLQDAGDDIHSQDKGA